MVEPISTGAYLLAMGAIAAVGAITQWWNSSQGRKADEETRKKIEKLFDEIKPPDYDVPIDAPLELHYEALKEPKYQQPLEPTKYNLDKIKQLQQYIPDLPKFVKEVEPHLLQENDVTKKGKDAQLEALDEYKRIAGSKDDPKYLELVKRATDRAQRDAQARSDTVLQQAGRRGQLGSGATLAAQLQGSSDAMNRSADVGLGAASEAYRNRLEALANSSNLGKSVRGQELDFQRSNNDVINDFNRRMSSREQELELQRANTRNEGQRYNIGEGQRIEEANIRRGDSIAERTRSEKERERNRLDAQEDSRYGRESGERDYRNNILVQNENARSGRRGERNDLTSRKYQDLLSKYRGKAGLADSRMQDSRDQRRSNGETISALQGAAHRGLSDYRNEQREDKRYDLEKQRYDAEQRRYEEEEKRRQMTGKG